MNRELKKISRRHLEQMLEQQVVSDTIIKARIEKHSVAYGDEHWVSQYTERFRNKYYGKDWFA